MEPIHVRRVLPEFHEAVELEEPARAVVEYAVENNAQPELVRLLYETVEILQRAENRVYLEVVDRMVAVVRVALENRAEVDGIYAQSRDVF